MAKEEYYLGVCGYCDKFTALKNGICANCEEKVNNPFNFFKDIFEEKK